MKNPIGWCDITWNPVVGCSKVSDGCRSCWAERAAHVHYSGDGKRPYLTDANGKWMGNVRLFPERLEWPLHRRKPLRIAMGLMSDLFHENVPDEFIDKIFAVMALNPRHTFQLLTKRIKRAHDYIIQLSKSAKPLESYAREIGYTFYFNGFSCISWPLPNVWLGVSCENQSAADERIPILLQTPAAVRFVSLEPMLGPVDIVGPDDWLTRTCCRYGGTEDPECGHDGPGCMGTRIDWVIVGGETGPGARPLHPDWVRSIRDQCQAAGVAFWFKSWGEWIVAEGEAYPTIERWVSSVPGSGISNGIFMRRVGKKSAGRLLDGKEWLEFPVTK